MSKRLTDRERLLSKLNHLNDREVQDVLDFVSRIESKKYDSVQRDLFDDELLVTLSSAVENRRAREVFEWEAIRRKAEARASISSNARR